MSDTYTSKSANTTNTNQTKSDLIELITNGTFTGSANNWTLGSKWSYASNQVIYTP